MRLAKLATCALNQWSMDFEGNQARILESVLEARARGARYRLGPELEIPGYGCDDHHLEVDTYKHSWEVLMNLLKSGATDGLLCDFGMPVLFDSTGYNCRVFCLDGKILFVRPKTSMCDDGNYRESRYFTAWTQTHSLSSLRLPPDVATATGQREVPFGLGILELDDATIGSETCEELFAPTSPSVMLGLNGCEIVTNGSGSHHQLRKLDRRMDLIRNAAAKSGGVYVYANQIGCDGGRLYYDGCSVICTNGDIQVQGTQFGIVDVEVTTAVIDLDRVSAYRNGIPSRCFQAAAAPRLPRVRVNFRLCGYDTDKPPLRAPTPAIEVRYAKPEEEIARGPAAWLWDYLRRSGAGGYFLPLSGGADSASTCALVGSMCQMVVAACAPDAPEREKVIRDVRRVVGEGVGGEPFAPDGDGGYIPTDARELCNRILHTAYMGSSNSSAETRDRAKRLAEDVGSYHMSIPIDTITTAIVNVFAMVTTRTPRFRTDGGSRAENLALQNIQARSRMVLAYLFAQLLPWVRSSETKGSTGKGRGGGFLLVLGSGNVDEALYGYLTKYDCSSADVNPIGGISKQDLRSFLKWASREDTLGYKTLFDVEQAKPTAELEPITSTHTQTDEEDMGLTYEELSEFGRVRKIEKCGPVSVFERLASAVSGPFATMSTTDVASKVKRFFTMHAVNRHKSTTLTPSYHAEMYSPDDNRFDFRPFLYRYGWPYQFQEINKRVAERDGAQQEERNSKRQKRS